jgi:hypothetical protein
VAVTEIMAPPHPRLKIAVIMVQERRSVSGAARKLASA